jgi:hypothetical protein
MEISEDNRNKLINNILAQAKYYLDNADEFYPFGAVIDNTNQLKPLSVFFGDDNPDSQSVFNQLEKVIKEGIIGHTYNAGAIGMDVYLNINEDGRSEKKTAIQINYYLTDFQSTIYYLYNKQVNGYAFIQYEMKQ